MADNCAEHASNVAGNEGDAELLDLVALLLGLGHDILVQGHHSVLKARCTPAMPTLLPDRLKLQLTAQVCGSEASATCACKATQQVRI